MYQVNDPMLALILRFVGRGEYLDPCNEEFIKGQIHTIQEHVEKFPPEEHQARALKWIEKHAKQYRKKWEKALVSAKLYKQKCADCPLQGSNHQQSCEVHSKWLLLLRQYTSDEINSERYIEDSLALLTSHKNEIKQINTPLSNPYLNSAMNALELMVLISDNYRTSIISMNYKIADNFFQSYIKLWKNSFSMNRWERFLVPA
ncbi:MAG: hypothetical protein HQM14_06965 [SAR324 cluster bacterium]|nr:hypothetical protein [SAR324 cluster bacterium]